MVGVSFTDGFTTAMVLEDGIVEVGGEVWRFWDLSLFGHKEN